MVSPLLSRRRQHLAENQVGYFGHMRFALGVGAQLLVAALACILHGILPGIFTDTASTAIRRLHAILAARHASPRQTNALATEAEVPA